MSGGEGKKEEEEEEGMLKLKSFIHEHPLALLDELTNGKNCNECGLYITGPTYICNTTGCEFSIHKSCVELPYEIHHPLHPDHPLTLANPPSPPTFNGIFLCELCRNVRDGFSFSCAECHFALDSHCALSIPTSLQHLSHEHPLDLVLKPNMDHHFQSIITRSKAFFECSVPGCEKILGFNRAFLPPKGMHDVHRHQLKLTFLPRNIEDKVEGNRFRPRSERDHHVEDDYYFDVREEPRWTTSTEHNPEDEYYCDACEKPRWGNGLLYCCEKDDCDFTTHTSCIASRFFQVFLQMKSSLEVFKDQSHDHVLTLMPPTSNKRLSFRKCHICTLVRDSPAYHCAQCNYNVGVRCATKLPWTRKIEEEKDMIKIFEDRELKQGITLDIRKSHQHPLAFSNVHCESERCNVCRLPISGANYQCNSCKFFLHELCTELPVEMEYVIDTYRTLILAEAPSPLYLNDMFLCAICDTPGDGFSYHCPESQSSFDVFVCHVDCILKNSHNFKHKCHKHPLSLYWKPMYHSHSCCACRNKVSLAAYYCDKCDIAVDVKCAHLPTTVTHESHPHPINLIADIQEPFYCDVCGEQGEWKGWAYICGDCKFVAHMSCICQGDPSPYMELGGTIKNQNHEHHLTLERRIEDASQCSHCDEPIERNLVYHCLECNYNLDLKCASRRAYAKPLGWTHEENEKEGREETKRGEEAGGSEMALEVEHLSHLHPPVLLWMEANGKLPCKIMFPLHCEHPLNLSKDPPPPFHDGIFYCSLCGTPGDGFSFSCAECNNYVLHVHCALTPMEIRVAGHKHLLTLEVNRSWAVLAIKCAACKRACEGAFYSCHNCAFFNLHVYCAFLPPRKKYRSHRHELSLSYRHVEEEWDVYYCDACEEERDPKSWVYCCEEECDFVAHTMCEPFPYLELGGTRKIGSHDHPVTLVRRKEDVHRYTDAGLLGGLVYQCTECTYKSDFFAVTPCKFWLPRFGPYVV